MKYLLIIMVIVSYSMQLTFAKEKKYSVSDIKPELLKNAKSVVRKYDYKITAKSLTDINAEVTYAITILNENGFKDSHFAENYNKQSRITNIKATLYDESGNKVKKFDNQEIYDISAISGMSVYEDNRVKYIHPECKNFPFTIEYSYIKHFKGSIIYPPFSPQFDFNMSVENAQFQITATKENPIIHYEKNTNIKPLTISEKQNQSLTWSFNNLKAEIEEDYTGPITDIVPIIYATSAKFTYDGFQGNNSSWVEFGNWVSELIHDRNDLTEEEKVALRQLVQAYDNDYDKAKALYEFMQQKTRYVSIQMGIGGFQPFKASFVHEYAYGDCKALTFYMKSLLDAVNIDSKYTLIRAGKNTSDIIKSYTASQFNHAILCLPMKGDTIWLECTNPYIPFGYMGTFIDNRYALLIDKDSSHLVKTSCSTQDDNQFIRNLNVLLDPNLSGKFTIKNHYKGMYTENLFKAIHGDQKDRQSFIESNIGLNNVTLIDFSYAKNKKRIPSTYEIIKGETKNFGNKSNNKILIPAYPFTDSKLPSYSNARRINNLIIKRPYTNIDTITFNCPESYQIAYKPERKIITGDFGNYELTIALKNNTVRIIRKLIIYSGEFPKEKYDDFIDFYDIIDKADRQFITFKKVTD